MNTYEGADDSGVVRVVVDQAGQVTEVAVAPNWREKVKPAGLGPALCTAANGALSEWALSERLADSVEHAEPEIAATVRQDARNAGGDPSSAVAKELVSELGHLLAAFERDLQSFRNELSKAACAVASVRGPRGAIEVAMNHGRVAGVTVRPGWAKTASNTGIRVEAMSAFAAAARLMADADPRDVTPPASIARLWELTRDPHSLSKELGLS